MGKFESRMHVLVLVEGVDGVKSVGAWLQMYPGSCATSEHRSSAGTRGRLQQ